MSSLMEHIERALRPSEKTWTITFDDSPALRDLYDWVDRELRADSDLIEQDLLSLPGVHRGLTAAEAEEMGLMIVRQRPPHDPTSSVYRGIWAHGTPLIDHHPEWGEVRGW